ncbi:30S ribosomal protein S17 [candidate division SR1 bacterium RAAC1_SR1_1]|nr:30S ribosomal protein S17 [candidate division SR1 bacterium RAAC1_SR1_1]
MAIIGNKNIKELIGEVISDKTDKTCVVLVKSVKIHPIYRKRFIVRKKYYVHDEQNIAKIGENVKFREIKPISKLKKWALVEIIK